MFKTAFAVALAALAMPAFLEAQDTPTDTSSSTSAATPSATMRSTTMPMAAPEKPFIDVAVGFNYLQTDLTNTPGGASSYTMGWYGIPQLHLTKHISVLGDFTNFYNWHAGTRENIHGMTGGPVYGIDFHHIAMYGFVEGGAVRDSRAGMVNWNPATVGGFGMNFKLSHRVGFQVVPGEYVATLLPNGNWQSNFTTKAGLVFSSFR